MVLTEGNYQPGAELAFRAMFNVFLSCCSRSDFVTLPFQGAEVLLDSVIPLSGNRCGLLAGGLGGAGRAVESRSFSLRASFSPGGLMLTWIAGTVSF